MNDLSNFQTILTSLVIAILTSFISVNIALRKYKSEKWWDIKTTCYVTIIEALNNMIMYCDLWMDVELDDKLVCKKTLENYHSEFNCSKLLLDKQMNIGNLLLSDEAYNVLLNLTYSLSKSENMTDITQSIAFIRCEVEECLHLLIPCAKKDLKITNSFLDK